MRVVRCSLHDRLLNETKQAQARISANVRRTPLLYSHSLSELARAEVYLKMECWQLSGSFKIRGALSMILSLPREKRQRGLVACSSGNHGIGVSYASRLLGLPSATVFVPQGASRTKARKMRLLGSQVMCVDGGFLTAFDAATDFARQHGATLVHSHAHPKIIAGQGTIGLEIAEDLPEADMVVIPIGGGGLISGVAEALRGCSRTARIIGAEPAAAPGAYLSYGAGECRRDIHLGTSLADGLVGTLSPLTFQASRSLVEDVVVVEEDEIRSAMRMLQWHEHVTVEGAGAIGLAAIQSGRIDVKGQKVVVIVTGRNIDMDQYVSAIKGGVCGEQLGEE